MIVAYARFRLFLAVTVSVSCGNPVTSPPDPKQVTFPGTAAVRVSPAGTGEWLLLFETLQPEFLVTTRIRSAGLVGADSEVVHTYDAPAGWTLIDVVAHPSGDVSLLSVRVDSTEDYPMRAMVSRFGREGAIAERELARLPPPDGTEPAPTFMASLDRARIVAHGEDLFAVVRWANNSVTRITGDGIRSLATLMGVPGRKKRLLNMRVAGDSVVLLGRAKTGDQPGSWDAWILFSRATGELQYERNVDVQNGDMFWDASALDDGRLLAVGSTNYTQNPSGLSVSDARDPLALVLDSAGKVEKRIVLRAGPAARGTEAMSVRVGDGNQVAISGVQNAPGTHAAVFSDAFFLVRGLDVL